MTEQYFTGTHQNNSPMTLRNLRRELRQLRKLYPDINKWECWYDAGEGTANWDGQTRLADILKSLRVTDPDGILVVEEHDGWHGPWEGFRYIPEDRCIIIDYNICSGGLNDEFSGSSAPD